MLCGGNYTKNIYNQLMEVMEKLDFMEAEHKKTGRNSRFSPAKKRPAQREHPSQGRGIRTAAG